MVELAENIEFRSSALSKAEDTEFPSTESVGIEGLLTPDKALYMDQKCLGVNWFLLILPWRRAWKSFLA